MPCFPVYLSTNSLIAALQIYLLQHSCEPYYFLSEPVCQLFRNSPAFILNPIIQRIQILHPELNGITLRIRLLLIRKHPMHTRRMHESAIRNLRDILALQEFQTRLKDILINMKSNVINQHIQDKKGMHLERCIPGLMTL